MTTSKNRSHHSGFMTRRHLLGTLILCGMMGNAYAGSCSGVLGTYTCSGVEDTANDIEQTLNGNSLSVMTLPGFGISTKSGNAFSLAADNELVFTDNNGATITGNVDGIYAVNIASGAILSITTTGTVTGSQGLGILGSTLGTDLTIDAADVSGNTYGIYAENYGTGSVSITATGSVVGAVNDGITAVNATGTDMTINAVNASGQSSGINALNFGTGATSISTTGTVTGKDSIGLYVGTLGTGLTLDAVNVLGGGAGIYAESSSGAMSITTTGSVIGALADGIYAYNAGTDQSIHAADVTGYTSGIHAENSGSGALSITTSGTVTGTTAYGVEAMNASNEQVSLAVLNGSTVQGAQAAILVDSSTSMNITNIGTIRNLSLLSSDVAIQTTGAQGTINNSNLVQGSVQLSDEGNIFRNNVDGVWDTAGGTNDLGALIASNAVFNNGSIVAANGSVADPLQVTTFNNVGTFSNAGVLTMVNDRAGDMTTINGNYEGNGGTLLFDTVLGDDSSATDKLVINGNTAGNTYVSVNNAGGSGAQTLNGIELIQVNGQSDGQFVQNGRIVAGAYDYSLARGVGTNATNWYLSSAVAPVDPTDPTDPDPSLMVERPEASGYAANLAAANNMFAMSLHDRLGETQYIDALTGEHKVTSLWLRNAGGHNRSRDTLDQLSTQANRYVVQLGGDIAQWSHDGQDRFHLGVMGGYANSKSRTGASLSGYSARASVDGYSTGVYGTWYANEADKSGLYVDSWAQYSWFNNTVDGQGLNTEEYKSKGWTASLESGYTFKVGENAAKNATYFIQPKAQVTWMGVKADDHKEVNGTQVSGEGDGNIQTRLGVKAFMNGYSEQDKGKDRVFQPFVEVNWVHNTKDFGTTMNGVSIKQDGAANIGELKVGVEGQINKQVNLWGNIGQQIGNKGYSDTSAMLGIKYNF
ncbi:autotransporter outer membrane beta-barrel domain-containing protein [Yersinia massiliensis]|uniref:autotransporter outer membrane beta-barrel domain-containing protein n=1 Tax=Yersinia massiliensis TaxID=419257 RepID=UPI00299DDC5A|nr:autotransporter outer membrane beta-barrel domain-containing protein [Yersinia massiliensis]